MPPCISCHACATSVRHHNVSRCARPMRPTFVMTVSSWSMTEICIGCKYCIQACPYDARFINPETGAADKCDFCVDRLAVGMEPACVATCFNRARIFGDLNDSNSEISRLIASNAVTVLRPEMGTQPNVFYIGIDYADEHDVRFPNQHIRVTTHRDGNKRR